MTARQLKSLKAKTLAWVNEVREKHGIGAPLSEMPRALPAYAADKGFTAMNCPIAVALGRSATWGYLDGYLPDGTEVHAPMFVRDFVLAMDAGRYPELLPDSLSVSDPAAFNAKTIR